MDPETQEWHRRVETAEDQSGRHLTEIAEGDVELLDVDEHRAFGNSDHLFIAWDKQNKKIHWESERAVFGTTGSQRTERRLRIPAAFLSRQPQLPRLALTSSPALLCSCSDTSSRTIEGIRAKRCDPPTSPVGSDPGLEAD